MADYYPLISRAVAGLEKNTGELRRALYERARTALVDQLRGVDPPLSESEITRERLALEEAIRKVETEEVRRIREAPRGGDVRMPPESVQGEDVPTAPSATHAEMSASSAMSPDMVEAPAGSATADDASAGPSSMPRRPARKRPPETRGPIPEENPDSGAAAESDALADPALRAAEEARKAYLAASPATPDPDRIEPRLDSENQRPASRRRGTAPLVSTPGEAGAREPETPADASPPRHFSGTRAVLEGPQVPDNVRFAAARARRSLDEDEEHEPLSRRLLSGLVRIAIGVVLILIVGATAYWQRHNLLNAVKSVASLVRTPSTQPPSDTAPQRTKIPDRIGQQEAVPGAGSAATTAPQGQVEAPVAQRVVLYEEDPNDSAGKQYVGTVVWRTEMVSPGPNQPPELAVRGDITIPERNMSVTWSLRRNTDKDLPASHTVSIMFTLPADFSHGGISEIRGVLMKQTEQTRGVSLAGLSVKVTTGFFLVGLSAADSDLQRNIQLLKDRSWFDIAIVYTDGRRAILAVEKGTPGDRAFAQAFSGWGQ